VSDYVEPSRRHVAIHEAGHAVASILLGFEIVKATIVTTSLPWERVTHGASKPIVTCWPCGASELGDTDRLHRRGWQECRLTDCAAGSSRAEPTWMAAGGRNR
jgi:hypothetical protein